MYGLKNWFIRKDPDAGEDWREEKGTTEDEMVGWHHQLNEHELEQAPGVGDGQGSLACCSPWGCKESGTWLIDWTALNWKTGIIKSVPENIYLKTCSTSFPGAHSGSPPWFLFRVLKIGRCSSTGFSLCRGRCKCPCCCSVTGTCPWQAPICTWQARVNL